MKPRIVHHAANANRVVGLDQFSRPSFSSGVSEFRRREQEKARYAHEIAEAKAVLAQHVEKYPVAMAPKSERLPPRYSAGPGAHFQLHWPNLLRGLAHLKRLFG